jgi:pimeloyl-ACP methyl ester carboxylesterase
VFVKLNLSHNGTTPDSDDLVDMEAFGHNNFSIELDDLGTLLYHLASDSSPIPREEADLERLALIGHSRGGGIVLLKAAEDERVKAVVTWAGISDLDQRWTEEVMEKWKKEGVQWVLNTRIGQQMPLYYQLVENYLANKDRLDIPAAVRRLRQPLLVLHGEQDETLPVKMAHDIHGWHREAELELLPEATHAFGGQHPFPHAELPADALRVADLSLHFLRKVFTHG